MIVSSRQAVGVAGVERRAQIDEHVELAERRAGEGGVGIRAVQIAAEAEAELQLAVVGAFHAGHRVEPRRRRQLDAEVVFAAGRRRASFSFGVTPTEPMPCTFEWPRIGMQPGARAADHAAQQRQVGDRLHVVARRARDA